MQLRKDSWLPRDLHKQAAKASSNNDQTGQMAGLIQF